MHLGIDKDFPVLEHELANGKHQQCRRHGQGASVVDRGSERNETRLRSAVRAEDPTGNRRALTITFSKGMYKDV